MLLVYDTILLITNMIWRIQVYLSWYFFRWNMIYTILIYFYAVPHKQIQFNYIFSRLFISFPNSHLSRIFMHYIKHIISSLQCYSVLSTIAQVLRKMSLKILVSWFLMPPLSHTFESYQRVKLYIYSVNDLDLKKLLQ